MNGERFIWCGEVYRFIWDPAPATVSRVEILENLYGHIHDALKVTQKIDLTLNDIRYELTIWDRLNGR